MEAEGAVCAIVWCHGHGRCRPVDGERGNEKGNGILVFELKTNAVSIFIYLFIYLIIVYLKIIIIVYLLLFKKVK